MKSSLLTAAVLSAAMFANDNSSMIPEVWANESLQILEETMLMGGLVHRDFENEIAEYGDIVNTRKPNNFVGKRKTDTDPVTRQNATSTKVQVKLDQWVHVSFMIRDGEKSKAFKDLVTYYLRPALIASAGFIDLVLSGQTIQFIENNAGRLGYGSSTTIDDYILDTREVLTNNKVPTVGRNLMLTTKTDTMVQKTEQFISAEKRGDGGNALETARLGTIHGFELFSAQNQPYVATGNSTSVAFLVNNNSSLNANDTIVAVDTGTGSDSFYVGTYVLLAGDEVPQRVTAVTNTGGTASSITVFPGISHAVANNAIVTSYGYGQVNLVAGYAAGYAKEVVYDTFTVDPKVGQPVNFGDGTVYSIVQVDTSGKTIMLDKPLVSALVNDQKIFVGPAGNYNLAFDRAALALVCRPLALPDPGLGAMGAVQTYNNASVRVVMTYDGDDQGTLVTVDALFGVKVLDVDRGCVLLA